MNPQNREWTIRNFENKQTKATQKLEEVETTTMLEKDNHVMLWKIQPHYTSMRPKVMKI